MTAVIWYIPRGLTNTKNTPRKYYDSPGSVFAASCWFSLSEFPLGYRVAEFLSDVFGKKSLNMKYIQIFNKLAETIITSDKDLVSIKNLTHRIRQLPFLDFSMHDLRQEI